jgi:hypothetical protein
MLRALAALAIIAASVSTFAVAQGPGSEHQEGKPHGGPPAGPPGAKPFIQRQGPPPGIQRQGPPPGAMNPYRGGTQPPPMAEPRFDKPSPGGARIGPPPGPPPAGAFVAPRPGNQFTYHGRAFDRVQIAPFAYPPGWGYRRWVVGATLPPVFLAPDYFYADWAALGLEPPPPGCEWVRYGPDLLLVDVSTGEVVDVAYDVFY